MGRPVKKGLDYFPTDVDFFEKEEIKFFSVECGASGICALMKLMCNIYRNGYYVEWSKDHEDLFGWDMWGMVPREEIPHIIGVCLKRGIFNSKLFKKFHILTSLDIQEVYLQALDGKRQISIIKEYWLTKIPDKAKFIGIDGEITEVGSLENRDKGLETEDKARNEKGFIPPTPEEVRQYFSDKGYSEEAANKAYDYYSAGNWKDSKGKRVKNWKQKMIAVWFKAENLKTIENGNKEGRIDF